MTERKTTCDATRLFNAEDQFVWRKLLVSGLNKGFENVRGGRSRSGKKKLSSGADGEHLHETTSTPDVQPPLPGTTYDDEIRSVDDVLASVRGQTWGERRADRTGPEDAVNVSHRTAEAGRLWNRFEEMRRSESGFVRKRLGRDSRGLFGCLVTFLTS